MSQNSQEIVSDAAGQLWSVVGSPDPALAHCFIARQVKKAAHGYVETKAGRVPRLIRRAGCVTIAKAGAA